MILRLLPDCENCLNIARVVLAIDLVCYIIRILDIFFVFKELGPKLVMISKMVSDHFMFGDKLILELLPRCWHLTLVFGMIDTMVSKGSPWKDIISEVPLVVAKGPCVLLLDHAGVHSIVWYSSPGHVTSQLWVVTGSVPQYFEESILANVWRTFTRGSGR